MTKKATQAPLPALRVYGQTHVGRRREDNEDNLAWQHVRDAVPIRERAAERANEWFNKLRGGMQLGEPIKKIKPEYVKQKGRLYVVADGVGGNDDGELASQYTVRHVIDKFYDAAHSQNRRTQLEQAVEFASQQVYEAAKQRSSNAASTVVAALVWDEGATRKVQFANVGDSPGYLFRANGSLTDTNVEQTRQHVDPTNNTLEQSMGDIELEPHFSPVHTLEKDDIVVLCSDGLSDLVRPDEIGRIVRKTGPQAATTELINLANERGGHDNITAVVLRNGSAPVPMGALGGIAGVLALLFLLVFGLSFMTGNSAVTAQTSFRPTLEPLPTRGVVELGDGSMATMTLPPEQELAFNKTATVYVANQTSIALANQAEATRIAQQPEPAAAQPGNNSGAPQPAQATPRPQPTATTKPAAPAAPVVSPAAPTASPAAPPASAPAQPTAVSDRDGDSVPDHQDACPDQSGPLNGCLPTATPNPQIADRDGDGVPDGEDFCPDIPQGGQGRGGCPDSDGDGNVDKDDACPNEPGTPDRAGCPAPPPPPPADSDGDGIPDDQDACPNGETGTGNGCPAPTQPPPPPPPADSDGDGIPDDQDDCPSIPGSPSHGGCLPPVETSPVPRGPAQTRSSAEVGYRASMLHSSQGMSPTASFTPTVYEVVESAEAISLTVALSPTSATTVSVAYSTTLDTAMAEDVVPVSGTLVFAPDTFTQTLVLSITPDLLPEPTESFTVALTSAEGAELHPMAAMAQVLIIDDDDQPEPLIEWLTPTLNITETITRVELAFTVEPPFSSTLVISTVAGTAQADQDFVPFSSTLELLADTALYTVTVELIDDSRGERDEFLDVHLYDLQGQLVDQLRITIINDDLFYLYLPVMRKPAPPPPPVCAFAGSPTVEGAPELLLDGRECVGDFNEQAVEASDYYTITVEANTTTIIDLLNQSTADNYDMYIYNQNFDIIGFSFMAGTSNEQATLPPTTPAGVYYVRVYWFQNNGSGEHSYTLSGQRQ